MEKMKYVLRLLIIIMLNVLIIGLIGYSYQLTSSKESAPVFSGIGSRGDEVRVIQEKLHQDGLFTGKIDGIYSSGTANAVKAFQRRNGLTVDGFANPATLSALGLPSAIKNGTVLPNSDYQLLARLISAESSGWPYIAQVAVGAIILNRVQHPSFPDTIAGVAYQPGAFASVSDGLINQSITESAYRAAKDAINGIDPSGGALYYYDPATSSNETLTSRQVILELGGLAFCS